jgi:apolipoprotein N-acyltransferase
MELKSVLRALFGVVMALFAILKSFHVATELFAAISWCFNPLWSLMEMFGTLVMYLGALCLAIYGAFCMLRLCYNFALDLFDAIVELF